MKATELSPEEDVERMIREGLINRRGQLTKLYGGEGEPEPGARRPTDASNGNGKP